VAAALEFLLDENAMRDIRSRLAAPRSDTFPSFEALLEVDKGVNMPRNLLK
jgi:hypothetical protein